MVKTQPVEDPKVFISYSWTTPEHEEWVLELATRLMNEFGIEVKLDKWDLNEGQDKYAFMEETVNSQDINKVLLICDEGFQEKADGRTGGVGTETQIITPEIYKDAKQEKFIPVIAQRDEEGNSYIPAFIKSRMYIDLSDDNYEEELERLVRNILNVPLHKKPKKGTPPAYLFEEESQVYKTFYSVKKMESLIDKQPKRLKYHAEEFKDLLIQSLDEAKIENVENKDDLDDEIINLINDMIPLRNDFVRFVELLCESEQLDTDLFVDIFEEIYPFTENQKSGVFYPEQFDHLKYFLTEIFLYTTVILIKHKKYNALATLITTDYENKSEIKHLTQFQYPMFRTHLKSLEKRNEKLKLSRVSLQADLVIEKAIPKYKDNLKEADLLLYYFSKKLFNEEEIWNLWVPITYIHFNSDSQIRLLNRMKSREHYENVKVLFNVEHEDELKRFISEFEPDKIHRGLIGKNVPNISNFIDPADICTIP